MICPLYIYADYALFVLNIFGNVSRIIISILSLGYKWGWPTSLPRSSFLPFLKIAVTYSSFHFSETSPICYNLSTMIKSDLTMTLASSLSPWCASHWVPWTCVWPVCSLIWSSSTEKGPLTHLEIYPLKMPYLRSQNVGPGLWLLFKSSSSIHIWGKNVRTCGCMMHSMCYNLLIFVQEYYFKTYIMLWKG